MSTAVVQQPSWEVLDLSDNYLCDICRLEKLCYPNPWSDQVIANEFKKAVSVRLGIVLSERLVAYCFCNLVIDEMHILNLAVDPELRNRGYAKELLGQIIERGISKGAGVFTLEVRESNLVALKLYSKFGFRPVGLRRRYYQDNLEDAIVLGLRVAEKDRESAA